MINHPLNLTLTFDLQHREALEKVISYVIDSEQDHFLESLPDLSPSIDVENWGEANEAHALAEPWIYDEDGEHAYTNARRLALMLEQS